MIVIQSDTLFQLVLFVTKNNYASDVPVERTGLWPFHERFSFCSQNGLWMLPQVMSHCYFHNYIRVSLKIILFGIWRALYFHLLLFRLLRKNLLISFRTVSWIFVCLEGDRLVHNSAVKCLWMFYICTYWNKEWLPCIHDLIWSKYSLTLKPKYYICSRSA